MNFIIHAVWDKKTKKIEHQGFSFSKIWTREEIQHLNKKELKLYKEAFLEQAGFSPVKYDVSFAHFKNLKKLRKAWLRALFWEKT